MSRIEWLAMPKADARRHGRFDRFDDHLGDARGHTVDQVLAVFVDADQTHHVGHGQKPPRPRVRVVGVENQPAVQVDARGPPHQPHDLRAQALGHAHHRRFGDDDAPVAALQRDGLDVRAVQVPARTAHQFVVGHYDAGAHGEPAERNADGNIEVSRGRAGVESAAGRVVVGCVVVGRVVVGCVVVGRVVVVVVIVVVVVVVGVARGDEGDNQEQGNQQQDKTV